MSYVLIIMLLLIACALYLCSYANAASNEVNKAKKEETTSIERGIQPKPIDLDYIEEPHIYAAELKTVREEQKALKNKNYATLEASITFCNSKKKGAALMKKVSKLVIAAFEGEADHIIKSVKHNNLETASSKIQKSASKFSKILAPNFTVKVTNQFIALKQKELKLYYQQAIAIQVQKEADAAFREELREQERAEKEYIANVKKTEAEVKTAQIAYDKAAAKFSGKLNEADETILALQAKLNEALSNNERAVSQAQLTRAGHIYVIKNTGSFGEGVYKVGMTRRLIPMDRVKELGDASVPFPFVVCAMFAAADAPALEKELHKALDSKRVNKTNRRKEFFRTDLQAIIDEVHKHNGSVVFNMSPKELEYEASKNKEE